MEGAPRDASEGKGPQRRPQRWLDRRLEEVANAIGGGYCRLQMPLKLALAVRGTVAGRRLGALGAYLRLDPPSNASLGAPHHECNTGTGKAHGGGGGGGGGGGFLDSWMGSDMSRLLARPPFERGDGPSLTEEALAFQPAPPPSALTLRVHTHQPQDTNFHRRQRQPRPGDTPPEDLLRDTAPGKGQ